MDTILIWTLFMIFVAALAGMVVRYRTLDKCLQGLDGYFVVIEWVDGRTAWGVLGVYHNAIELVFPSPHVDPAGAPTKTSYIIYKGQFKDICGILKEYTGDFICILDVALAEDHAFELKESAQLKANRNLDFSVEQPGEKDLIVGITNRGDMEVQVEHAEGEGYRQDIARAIPPGESARFELTDLPTGAESAAPPPVTLVIRARRIADLVVPRTRGIIRHGSEQIAGDRIKML